MKNVRMRRTRGKLYMRAIMVGVITVGRVVKAVILTRNLKPIEVEILKVQSTLTTTMVTR
ncbi:hypothetical protein CROQUDRAFT_86127 [Cronartium quercuum f. sp. fusiforme G11]|uniref:Uncharacterized protein n=1 Tax=Cronartium quercuum f. sp. fusiforme G11 TaxID=708437 RepID=A0A9P6NUL0_9BASI|nr:hypothetical protein CROQUDRAFT_86127 [Cronartium quercuum f. sp. fusiforme G11]